MHEELFQFFKAMKDLKKRPKGENKQVGKKADEAKAMLAKALKDAPAYHRGRRVYLAGLLEQQGREGWIQLTGRGVEKESGSCIYLPCHCLSLTDSAWADANFAGCKWVEIDD